MHFGCGGTFPLQVSVGVFAFQNSGQEGRIAIACRLQSSLHVTRFVDDGDENRGVFRQSNLGAWARIGADGLHSHSMRQNAVMANLVDLRGIELQAGRELADLVAQVGKADKFVGGEEVVNAVGQFARKESRVVAKCFTGVARLPAVRERRGQIPVKKRHIRIDAVVLEFVDDALVVIETFAVGLADAIRKYTRPRDGHAVHLGAKVLQQLDVLFIEVIRIVCNIAGLTVKSLTGRV